MRLSRPCLRLEFRPHFPGTRSGLPNGPRIVAPKPMTTPASATIGVARSSRQLGQSIALFRINAVQNFAQLDSVETQQAGKLTFAHQPLAVGFGRQEIQPQRAWLLGANTHNVFRNQIVQYFSGLLVGELRRSMWPVSHVGTFG